MLRMNQASRAKTVAAGIAVVSVVMSVGLYMQPSGRAQTAVDLRTQSRNVDFSAAVSTRPAKTGTILPAVCSAGEMFFKTNATAGSNLFLCSSTNVWTVVQGVGGTGTTASSLTSGTLAARPSTCIAGAVYFASDTAAGQNVFVCVSANTWKQISYTAGGSGVLNVDCGVNPCTVDILTSVVPRLSTTNDWTGTNNFSGAASLLLPAGAGSAPILQASMALDTNTNRISYGTGGGNRRIATMNGSPAAGRCASWDASGNVVDAGTLCGPAMTSAGRMEPFGPVLGAADPGASSSLEVRYFGFANPYAMTTVSRIHALSFAQENGRGFAVGVYDSNCTLLAQSDTVASPVAGQTATFTFSPALSLAGGYYYLAYTADCASCSLAHQAGTGNYYGLLLNSDPAPHAFAGSNAAVQPGGTGTAINLPVECGTKSALSGATAQPPVSMIFN